MVVGFRNATAGCSPMPHRLDRRRRPVRRRDRGATGRESQDRDALARPFCATRLGGVMGGGAWAWPQTNLWTREDPGDCGRDLAQQTKRDDALELPVDG